MRLDPVKVDFYRIRAELTAVELREKALIREDTWEKILRGDDIWLDSAVNVRKALGVPDLFAIMHPSKLIEFTSMFASSPAGIALPDWDLDVPLSGCTTASNGASYYLWKLVHRLERNRFARGKCYDLSALPTREHGQIREYVVRHGEVCNRLADHPRFPKHFTTTPDASGKTWWVIDEWTPGPTLEEVLFRKPLHRDVLPRVMREIADGLKALHGAKVIRRELAPPFVILREPDMSVVLTDFELGKVLEGAPTVSVDWPADRYRAPEVGGKPLTEDDVHVDLYSWGRIFVHAATGTLPDNGKEDELLDATKLPPKVRDIVKRCVGPADARPQDADEVLKALRGWK